MVSMRQGGGSDPYCVRMRQDCGGASESPRVVLFISLLTEVSATQQHDIWGSIAYRRCGHRFFTLSSVGRKALPGPRLSKSALAKDAEQ